MYIFLLFHTFYRHTIHNYDALNKIIQRCKFYFRELGRGREIEREKEREKERGKEKYSKKMYTVSSIALEYIVTMDALEHEQLF